MKFIALIITFFFLNFGLNAQTKTYTLVQYLNQVKAYSKDLKLAKQELEAAKVNKKQAVSLALPHISAKADYKRNLKDMFMYVDFSVLNGEGGTEKFKINRKNEFGFTAVLNQTLFSIKVGNALTAAKQYQKLVDYLYESSYQKIITTAKKGFYQALLLNKVWEVREASQNNAYENYLDMKKKFESGIISEFQLMQAEVRWKDQIPQTTEARRNYKMLLVNLKTFAGIPVEQEITFAGEPEDYPNLPERIAFESILRQRPDFNALLWEEKLKSTKVKSDRAEHFPSLTGSLAYGYSAQSDAYALDEENNALVAGVTLSIPLFTGGYISSQVQKSQIELNKTRINMERSKDDIYQQIASIRLRLNEAQERIHSTTATMRSAEKAFQIAEVTAKNGLATQLELKDSRIVFDQAKLAYHAAIFNYLCAYFDWEQAVGMVKD